MELLGFSFARNRNGARQLHVQKPSAFRSIETERAAYGFFLRLTVIPGFQALLGTTVSLTSHKQRAGLPGRGFEANVRFDAECGHGERSPSRNQNPSSLSSPDQINGQNDDWN